MYEAWLKCPVLDRQRQNRKSTPVSPAAPDNIPVYSLASLFTGDKTDTVTASGISVQGLVQSLARRDQAHPFRCLLCLPPFLWSPYTEYSRPLYFHPVVCSLWPPYVTGQAIIFLPCGFVYLLSSSSFFSSPNLSGHRLDVYHTSTHGVALCANLECRSKMCCSRIAANTGRKEVAKNRLSGHHRTTSSRYIFATKARIDNQKKIVKQQYILPMFPQYVELRPTSG